MNEILALKQRVDTLLKELHQIGPVMRGTVTGIGNKTRRPHFSVSIAGKTKLIYLGEKKLLHQNSWVVSGSGSFPS